MKDTPDPSHSQKDHVSYGYPDRTAIHSLDYFQIEFDVLQGKYATAINQTRGQVTDGIRRVDEAICILNLHYPIQGETLKQEFQALRTQLSENYDALALFSYHDFFSK